MKKLPKHIIKAVINNNTSLGDHPAFPPDEEDKFLVWVLSNYYSKLSDGSEEKESDIQIELGKLLKECKKNEDFNRNAIEELCNKYITELFEIPEDTINISVKLSDTIDTSNQRLIPEKTDDFSFDSIDDMTYLTDEIYKRRMLNCLIYGASLYYANDIYAYVQDLFRINPELPSLYQKILNLNTKLMFIKKDTLDTEKSVDAGKVDVYMSTEENKVEIKAEALILPILIEETVKGLLELAISHGLPQNREKAEYVIKKADFKLAEIWDMRLGSALWDLIIRGIEKLEIDFDKVGVNFFFMELSSYEPSEFNKNLREIFKFTKEGQRILRDICDNIINEKEKDDFDDFIASKNNGKFTMTDGYYTSDELDSANYFNSNELISDSLE